MYSVFLLATFLTFVVSMPPTPPPLPKIELCNGNTCGIHQVCLEQDGVKSCVCDFNCDDDEEEKYFCDFEGRAYKNKCEIRLRECLTKRKIFYLPGKCEKCTVDGVDYSYGQVIIRTTDSDETPCVEEVCKHGYTAKTLNKSCLTKLSYTCTMGAKQKGFETKCEELGMTCKITKWSKNIYDYPHLGQCVDETGDFCYHQGKEYKLDESFVTEDCTSRCVCNGKNEMLCTSLCPPQISQCKDDETLIKKPKRVKNTQCNCIRPRCVRNSEICQMKAAPGECYAYFERWYYNPTKKSCQMFVYGGCRGNGNRFNTKEECEQKCIPVLTLEKSSEIKEKITKGWTWPVAKPQKPILTDNTILVKGKINLGGFERTLPSPSCLFVTLEDVSLMDAPSVVIKSQRFNLSTWDTNKPFPYVIEAKKPADNQLWRSYSMAASVHVGWCPEKREVIREGDYLSDTTHSVSLTKGENDYIVDVNLICYECERVEKEKLDVFEGDDSDFEGGDDFEGDDGDFNGDDDFGPPSVMTGDDMGGDDDKPLEDTTEDDSNKSKKKILLGNEQHCQFEGKRYGFLEEFANRDCTGFCACGVNGAVKCTTLCTPTVVKCAPGEVQETMKIPNFLDNRCSCEETICVRKECEFEGVMYPINTKFIDKNCTGVCQCDVRGSIGCVSLCPPVNIMCLPGQKEVTVKEPIADSTCTCDRPSCVDIEARAPRDITLPDPVIHDEEFQGEGGFPDSNGRQVTLENDKTIEIKGKIIFSREVGYLPSLSCMEIKFEDISLMDASSTVIKAITIDMSNKTVGKEYSYTMTSYKPIESELSFSYSLSVVLNIGWCKNKLNNGEWIREGDYNNDVTHTIDLSKDKDTYVVDIKAKCYACKKKPDVKVVTPLIASAEVRDDVPQMKSTAPPQMKTTAAPLKKTTAAQLKKTTAAPLKKTTAAPLKKTTAAPLKKTTAAPLKKTTALPPKYSCYDNVKNIARIEGEVWKNDDCTTCECENGQNNCMAIDCQKPDCENPTYIEGKCCPECIVPETKECYNDNMKKTFKDGEIWKQDLCTTCKCEKGKEICASQTCAKLLCKKTKTEPGACCPVCDKRETCYDESTKRGYKEREHWVRADGCTRCTCWGGSPYCASPMCVRPHCKKGATFVSVKGLCCPVCSNAKVCTSETGKKYVEGNVWQTNDCMVCHCLKDGIECVSPNEDFDGCKSIIKLNPQCGKICYDQDRIFKKMKEP